MRVLVLRRAAQKEICATQTLVDHLLRMGSTRHWWRLIRKLHRTINAKHSSVCPAQRPCAGQYTRRECLVPSLGTEKTAPAQGWNWLRAYTSEERAVAGVRVRPSESCETVGSGGVEGQFELESLEQMARRGKSIPSNKLNRILQDCLSHGDLDMGRRIHALVVRSGFQSDPFLANQLIRMYASNSSLMEASQVFRNLRAPNEFAWRSIISAHVEHGEAEQAMELYHELKRSSVKPNDYIFVAVLKACLGGWAESFRWGGNENPSRLDCHDWCLPTA